MDDATQGPVQARSVDTGRGVAWWTEGWALFMKNPGMWIVLGLILLIIFVVLAFVPLLGSLVASALLPVFTGGWMLAARKVEAGGTLEAGDLFAGFRDKLAPLLIVGVLLLAATLVIGLVVGGLGFGAAMGMMGARHSAAGAATAMGTGVLAMLIGLVLGVAIAMAIWFAPALVVFRGVAPVDALKVSARACWKNTLPFTVYGALYFVAAIAASITFGLGWIVLVPMLMLTAFTSYKDVFGAP